MVTGSDVGKYASSWSAYGWNMLHSYISHVTRMTKSCHSCEHGRCGQSWTTCDWNISHNQMSHISRMTVSRHTCECADAVRCGATVLGLACRAANPQGLFEVRLSRLFPAVCRGLPRVLARGPNKRPFSHTQNPQVLAHPAGWSPPSPPCSCTIVLVHNAYTRTHTHAHGRGLAGGPRDGWWGGGDEYETWRCVGAVSKACCKGLCWVCAYLPPCP